MYSVVFQLSGSILLSWMVISRTKKEIIQLSWTTVNIDKQKNPKIFILF